MMEPAVDHENSSQIPVLTLSPFNGTKRASLQLDEYAIHDSTLREGEQTPGVHYTVEDKCRIARKLDEAAVRRIEAGFPAASLKQLESIKEITRLDLDARLSAFARARREDIDAVAESGAGDAIVSFSVSQYHRLYKFKGLSKEEYLTRLADAVSYAESRGLFVIYSAEDCSREEDAEFLQAAYRTAVESGAKRVRVIDTLGCLTPFGAGSLVSLIRNSVDAPIEVHFHNDLGLSLANSLAAIDAGASTISTAVNGIGERAGITATEEAVASLLFFYGLNQFRVGCMTDLSDLVSEITGIPRHPHKPITGRNVLTHSSGIHQHGIHENAITYEFYPPGLFGRERGMELNELSGRHGVILTAEQNGVTVTEETARRIVQEMKRNYTAGRREPYASDEIMRLIKGMQEV